VMRLRKMAMETTPADRATFADSDRFTLSVGIRLFYLVRELQGWISITATDAVVPVLHYLTSPFGRFPFAGCGP